MIKRDFHGWTLDDAVQEIHNIVGDVRKRKISEHAELITGRGVIKEHVFQILKIQYGLVPEYQYGNDGTIQVIIE